jgi:hypothetical protein
MFVLISALLVMTQASELGNDSLARICLVRNDQKDLADRIRIEFKINDRLAVYQKILQAQRIELSKRQDRYSFVVRDGKCWRITTYRGTVRVDGAAAELNVESETKEAVPC